MSIWEHRSRLIDFFFPLKSYIYIYILLLLLFFLEKAKHIYKRQKVWIEVMFGYALRFTAFSFCVFPFSFFFFACIFPQQVATVHALYINSSRNFWPVFREQCTDTLFTDPQISFFINFFIKNGFQSTIHTFKNYFAAVFSVFSFSKISSIQTDPETKQNSMLWVNRWDVYLLIVTYVEFK